MQDRDSDEEQSDCSCELCQHQSNSQGPHREWWEYIRIRDQIGPAIILRLQELLDVQDTERALFSLTRLPAAVGWDEDDPTAPLTYEGIPVTLRVIGTLGNLTYPRNADDPPTLQVMLEMVRDGDYEVLYRLHMLYRREHLFLHEYLFADRPMPEGEPAITVLDSRDANIPAESIDRLPLSELSLEDLVMVHVRCYRGPSRTDPLQFEILDIHLLAPTLNLVVYGWDPYAVNSEGYDSESEDYYM
ncbi:hypothetical protein GY45DRAFT_1340256 [Cubamyces sp. BRFM 1775]|nr:hypothetical protein GY45DRAFT_1340256 [Cubamyces sp. BRFM 1775]